MLRLPRSNAPRATSIAYLDISHAGETYRISLRRLAAARRFTLRVRAATQDVVLTMPARGSVTEAKFFADRHAAWIGTKLRRLPARIPFTPGEAIPLRGTLHVITQCVTRRGAVWIQSGVSGAGSAPLLCVGGEAPFVSRKVLEYLHKEAKKDLEAAVRTHTRKLGIAARRITLRDTVSRWGSCSTSGTLNFSWRLIMAPHFVLDYLAAHEAAHLLHMNHSPEFWGTVARLTSDTDRAEAWLKAHGTGLLHFGPDP
ncbi:MAG: M48 family metallopeptidase [Beijerinckiaceae bacterium]|nr:M48 family metallopeptidase [Beijerinckiaceae bacterium]